MTTPRLLLIDRTSSLAELCQGWQRQTGYVILEAQNTDTTLQACRTQHPAVAILELEHDWAEGLQLMQACLDLSPATRFILIGNACAPQSIVKAMRAGAFDILSAPVDKPQLYDAIMAAFSDSTSTETSKSRPQGTELIGQSPIMLDVFSRIKAISSSNGNVFITGESGTGKALCALTIHRSSDRSAGPFVVLKCGGMPESLLNAELFGEAMGHPGSDDSQNPGAFVRAQGGTLFLDDVCDLTPEMQTKLLHLLETAMVTTEDRPTGRAINARLICATNRDPAEELAAKRLRSDLFFRLFVLPLHMPPLRDRTGDIVELVDAYLDRICLEEKKSFKVLSEDARTALISYAWPGNVRQLINILRHAVVMNDHPIIDASMLPSEILEAENSAAAVVPSGLPIVDLLGRPMIEVERRIIEANIQAQSGSVIKAAEILGVSPSTIYRKRETWH